MSRDATSANLFCRQIGENIARHRLFKPGERPVVGFSGGADSTALLLVLKSLGLAPRAVHLHHGLRGEAADADEEWCGELCERFAIDYSVGYLDPQADPHDEGLEAALRRQRLDWWRTHTMTDEVVTLGHHADDALETMLMHMMRGANATGLTALRGRRVVAGVTLVRPLLVVDRAAIIEWLGSIRITNWREDASNTDGAFLRNRVRHELLPLLRDLGHGDAGLRLSRDHLAEDASALEERVAAIPLDDQGGVGEATMLATPASLWPRLLRRLGEQAGTDLPVRGAAVDRLRDWLTQHPEETSGWMDLDADYVLHRGDGRLWVAARAPDCPAIPERLWDWRREPTLALPELGVTLTSQAPGPSAPPADPAIAAWPAATLPCPLTVRARRPGDRFTPFGMEQSVRVKKVVGASSLSAAARARLLVVCGPDGTILWLPGLRRAADLPITAATEATVALIFESHTLL